MNCTTVLGNGLCPGIMDITRVGDEEYEAECPICGRLIN